MMSSSADCWVSHDPLDECPVAVFVLSPDRAALSRIYEVEPLIHLVLVHLYYVFVLKFITLIPSMPSNKSLSQCRSLFGLMFHKNYNGSTGMKVGHRHH